MLRHTCLIHALEVFAKQVTLRVISVPILLCYCQSLNQAHGKCRPSRAATLTEATKNIIDRKKAYTALDGKFRCGDKHPLNIDNLGEKLYLDDF